MHERDGGGAFPCSGAPALRRAASKNNMVVVHPPSACSWPSALGILLRRIFAHPDVQHNGGALQRHVRCAGQTPSGVASRLARNVIDADNSRCPPARAWPATLPAPGKPGHDQQVHHHTAFIRHFQRTTLTSLSRAGSPSASCHDLCTLYPSRHSTSAQVAPPVFTTKPQCFSADLAAPPTAYPRRPHWSISAPAYAPSGRLKVLPALGISSGCFSMRRLGVIRHPLPDEACVVFPQRKRSRDRMHHGIALKNRCAVSKLQLAGLKVSRSAPVSSRNVAQASTSFISPP